MKSSEGNKRGGRPRKLVKRETTTGIRFTKVEHFIIEQKAKKAGMHITQYIRQMAIHGIVKTRLSEEDRHFVRQLVGMSNNLNQVAKCCHEEGALTAILHFESYRNQIDELLKQLKSDK